MDFKLSSFLIAMVVIGLIITGFTIFMGEMNNNYSNTDYNSTELNSLNKMSDVTAMALTMRNSTSIDQNANLFDVFGAYFTSGYKAVKAAAGSVDTFMSLNDEAAKKSGIPYIQYVTSAIMVIVLIIIFIGILLSLLTRRPM